MAEYNNHFSGVCETQSVHNMDVFNQYPTRFRFELRDEILQIADYARLTHLDYRKPVQTARNRAKFRLRVLSSSVCTLHR
jgi:hypothetical protein